MSTVAAKDPVRASVDAPARAERGREAPESTHAGAIRPATEPRGSRRLLVIDPARDLFEDTSLDDGLLTKLRAGDLLVLNDAATIPASFAATHGGAPVEVRLLRRLDEGRWQAVLLGAGDWRTPTENRPAPPAIPPGGVLVITPPRNANTDLSLSRLRFSATRNANTDLSLSRLRFSGARNANTDLSLSRLRFSGARNANAEDRRGSLRFGAVVDEVSALSPRLVTLRFDRSGDALWKAIYAHGRPVQYSYQRRPLALWDVQTRYGSRPWAVEPPSAGLPLTWSLLARLAKNGVAIATLTHEAGLSSTGDPAIDAALPLSERYELPAATIRAISRARRVIAVGTSVVRALEGCARTNGRLVDGTGETSLKLGPGSSPAIVHGLLTGIHEPTASHFQLLQTFCPLPLLERAYAAATDAGYLCHEFGDSNLIL